MDGRTKSGHEDTRGYALIGPIGLNWIVFNCPGSNRIAECWQFMVLNCLENTSIVDIVGVRFVSSCNLFVCVCVFVMFVVGCFITDTHTHGNTSKHISKTTSDILNQAFIRSNLICFWLIRFCFYCLMFYNPSTARIHMYRVFIIGFIAYFVNSCLFRCCCCWCYYIVCVLNVTALLSCIIISKLGYSFISKPIALAYYVFSPLLRFYDFFSSFEGFLKFHAIEWNVFSFKTTTITTTTITQHIDTYTRTEHTSIMSPFHRHFVYYILGEHL